MAVMAQRVLTLALSALLVAPALAVTITFTGVSGSPGDVSFDGPLALQGIAISVNGGPAVVGGLPGAPAGINNPSLITHTTGNNPGAPSTTRIDFLHGTRNETISLAVWDTESSVSVTSYNAAGLPVETVNLTSLSAVLAFSVVGHADYLIITDSGGDGHVWDNLTYLPNPEPSTFVLVGIALVGIGVLRRGKS